MLFTRCTLYAAFFLVFASVVHAGDRLAIGLECRMEMFQNGKQIGVGQDVFASEKGFTRIRRARWMHYTLSTPLPPYTNYSDVEEITVSSDDLSGWLVASLKPPRIEGWVDLSNPPDVRNEAKLTVLVQPIERAEVARPPIAYLLPPTEWPELDLAGNAFNWPAAGEMVELSPKVTARFLPGLGSFERRVELVHFFDDGLEQADEKPRRRVTFSWDEGNLETIESIAEFTDSTGEAMSYRTNWTIQKQFAGERLPATWKKFSTRIPNGAPVVLMETQQIEAEWRDGDIVRIYDSGVVKKLGSVSMAKQTSWWPVGLGVAALGFIALWYWFGRAKV